MTFTITSKDILEGRYYVSITQDAWSNILKVQAWKCDAYGFCKHLINECSYHKDDIKKAKATYNRYIRKIMKGE